MLIATPLSDNIDLRLHNFIRTLLQPDLRQDIEDDSVSCAAQLPIRRHFERTQYEQHAFEQTRLQRA
jgi:hypothetical protein